MIERNWRSLIRPEKLGVEVGADAQRSATVVAEPLERGFGMTLGNALRRVLLDLLAGEEPRDLPPADTDDLARRGFGLLLGLQLDWAIPTWETITADGPPEAPDEEDEGTTPEQARRAALFDGWRGAVFEASGGGVPPWTRSEIR